MKLHDVVQTIMRDGRGILAADESVKTAGKRLEAVGVESTEENRRRYRELLFTTPGIEKFLSGIIFFDETLRQSASDGTPFPDLIASKNIIVGIKVDGGLTEDPNFPGGEVTEGLEGLGTRLAEYKSFGAQFAKWRATAKVGVTQENAALRETINRMAVYAKICHENNFVPIIEPEVLMEGGHTASGMEDTLVEVLALTFDALKKENANLPDIILKTSMAVSGKSAENRAAPSEVAERTVRALTASLPENLGGVVFLSGGQSPEEATANLNAIAHLEPLPWPLTFSFSRALQGPVLPLWAGKDENVPDAQAIFLKRVSFAALADVGSYTAEMES